MDEKTNATIKHKLNDALKTCLPTQENNGNLWIIHYSPVTIVFTEKLHRESFLIIDRTSLYFFILPQACCGGCGGSPALEKYEELRVPLVAISSVNCEGMEMLLNFEFIFYLKYLC